MARFSQAFLQGLLQPTYQQGLFEAARGVGQLPAVVESERQRQQIQTQAQQLLQQNRNNPTELRRLAQQYSTQGNENIAKAFETAATAATTRQEQMSRLTAGQYEIQAEINRKRAEQARRQTEQSVEDRAVQVAAERGDTQAASNIRRGVLKPDDYLEEVRTEKPEEPETPKDYSLTEREEILYNEILQDNREEFQSLIETVEKEPLLTIPYFGKEIGGGEEAIVEIDESTRTLFDNAERIRTNNPSLTKKQALRQAVTELNSEAIYSRLPEESQNKVNQLRSRGVSEELILEAMKTELRK
jgi:hypothetical protein